MLIGAFAATAVAAATAAMFASAERASFPCLAALDGPAAEEAAPALLLAPAPAPAPALAAATAAALATSFPTAALSKEAGSLAMAMESCTGSSLLFSTQARPTGFRLCRCLFQNLSSKRSPLEDASSVCRSSTAEAFSPLSRTTFSTTGSGSVTVFLSVQQKTVEAPMRMASWEASRGVGIGARPKPMSIKSSCSSLLAHLCCSLSSSRLSSRSKDWLLEGGGAEAAGRSEEALDCPAAVALLPLPLLPLRAAPALVLAAARAEASAGDCLPCFPAC